MYKSPITVYEQFNPNFYNDLIDKMIDEQNNQTDDRIYTEVRKIGIDVDKDELLKALKYDRQQYEKGYRDGKQSKISHWYLDEDRHIRCCNCDEESYVQNLNLRQTPFCAICGCEMNNVISDGKQEY
jgi:hypothetical protein